MFYLLVLTDFILFLYIYVGTQWVGWTLQDTLASKAGTALMLLSVFIIVKKGLSLRPLKPGRTVVLAGLAILLTGFVLSLNTRSSDTLTIAEGESTKMKSKLIGLQEVITEDSPGLIRNDVFAKITFSDTAGKANVKNEIIQIMPIKLHDGGYWRIVRFGYSPVVSWSHKGVLIGKDKMLLIASESWTGNDEVTLMEAGLVRNPPPRMMLGVGAFPPEMEAIVDPDMIEKSLAEVSPATSMQAFKKDGQQKRKLFIRISGAHVNGKQVSLEGEDYWRYLTKGRLNTPALSVSALSGKDVIKTQKIIPGEEFLWGDTRLEFKKLNYWVELERRQDSMVPVIIFGLFVTYLGVAVTIVQFLVRVKKDVRANNS